MPPICNVNAVITCPHQSGMVKPVPKQMTVMVGGSPALRVTDMAGAPVLPGCPNLPTPATPAFVPCATVVTPAVMGSTKVMIGGVPALLAIVDDDDELRGPRAERGDSEVRRPGPRERDLSLALAETKGRTQCRTS